MASYESDEEQIEALKNWWKENGNSLLMGVVIVLVVLFGSRQWQSSQTATAEAASDLYESIVQLAALGGQSSVIAEATIADLESSNQQLRNEYADSIYARYSALIMATMYVNQEDYDQAATELNWILDNPELGFMKSAEEELFLAARLRLARVKLAQGMAQEALDLVTAVEPGELEAGYSEVQGDAYLQMGQIDQARSAYERALSLNPENANFIELKILGIGS